MQRVNRVKITLKEDKVGGKALRGVSKDLIPCFRWMPIA